MNCQHRSCSSRATKVRDVPTLGESLCFCDEHVNEEIQKYNEDFGWYDLAPEREVEEIEAEITLRKIIPQHLQKELMKTEAERRAWCCDWAKRLFTRWHSMHGISGHEAAWEALGEWGQSYWCGVAEFVYENFDEKETLTS